MSEMRIRELPGLDLGGARAGDLAAELARIKAVLEAPGGPLTGWRRSLTSAALSEAIALMEGAAREEAEAARAPALVP